MARRLPEVGVIGIEIRKPAYELAMWTLSKCGERGREEGGGVEEGGERKIDMEKKGKEEDDDDGEGEEEGGDGEGEGSLEAVLIQGGPPRNLTYLNGNINVDVDRILSNCREAGASAIDVAIQFPDPHFKLRNHKRRVVNPTFAKALSIGLPTGSTIWVQSDVEVLAVLMVSELAQIDRFRVGRGYDIDRLDSNPPSPYGVATERERACRKRGLPIYRMLFEVICLYIYIYINICIYYL